MGAHALGRAWCNMTLALDAPLSCAISMYGLANRLMMAARVMRIMCATITKVRAKAGKVDR